MLNKSQKNKIPINPQEPQENLKVYHERKLKKKTKKSKTSDSYL